VPLPDNDPAVIGLDRLATIASEQLGQQVTRSIPADSGLGWKSGSIHPLQVLGTQYPGIVHDAVRGMIDPEARKQAESKALGQFFFFDAGAPRLLGVGPGEAYAGRPYPLPSDQLRAIRRELKAARQLLQPPQGVAVDLPGARQHLLSAWRVADGLRGAFLTIPGSAGWPVAPIVEAGQQLAGLDQVIPTGNLAQLSIAYRQIKAAADALDEAVSGVGTVQIFYVIEGFYLFRLLVRYRLKSSRAISPEAAATASGMLTELLANGHDWLSEWLRDKIVDFAARIAAVDPSGNTLFFLKGGRAIKYLEDQPEGGRNDWDTQIVINPLLPAAGWYALFVRVVNEALLALEQYKFEFYMLLNHHAPDFEQELDDAQAEAEAAEDAQDDGAEEEDLDAEPVVDPIDMGIEAMFDLFAAEEEPAGPKETNCKGELIDIGLPRYDSVEAYEQWTQLRGQILVADDGIPYPGYLYYVNEYLLMLRQVFAGASPSARKAPTRTKRLYGILGLAGTQVAIDGETAAAELLLPLSFAQVSQEPDLATRYALRAALVQFAEAYGFAKEPTFAAAFDQWLQPMLQGLVPQVAFPAAFMAGIQEMGAGWTPGYQRLAGAIAFCQWVSNQMEAHLTQRGRQLGSDPALRAFITAMAAIFPQWEEWELQLALGGSLAAAQQADYAQYAHVDELDPVTYASLGFYSPLENADYDTIYELVTDWVEGCAGGFTVVPDDADRAIRLYWNEQTIGLFTYAPLAAEAVLEQQPARPLVSWIWGVPMLGLPDLVRQYRRTAAQTEEFGRREVDRRTAAALTDISTSLANPEPPNPAIAALRDGRCNNLMISSASNAAGRNAAYPQPYYV
jgi:hypothetical protein